MKNMTTSAVAALLLALTPVATAAQQGTAGPGMRSDQQSMMHRGDRPGMMDPAMRGQGMMGERMMGSMRIMMILMDTDGDGALSLEEVQAAHARIFRAVDADGNGRVTPEEMQSFMRGMTSPVTP